MGFNCRITRVVGYAMKQLDARGFSGVSNDAAGALDATPARQARADIIHSTSSCIPVSYIIHAYFLPSLQLRDPREPWRAIAVTVTGR